MIKIAKEIENGNRLNYRITEISKINEFYSANTFDIAIVSGVICFLDENELLDSLKKIHRILRPRGILLLATNHTDSYFKKAKSK